ncbi:MAG TPA: MYXO-CTERM sorting domain-containing protein [Kofleriaceae bacterium]|jgi:uncharacterized protein (TIGR03382 family)|nr:MYXO-CTERM sorting domain-containing protein [Kofleriaceae bacterium]
MRLARTGLLVLAGTSAPIAAHADVVNGSFETGDYSGWTLTKDAKSATFATAGVLESGTTVKYADSVHDYHDGMDIAEYSSSLPLTAVPTDGGRLAVQLQNGPATTRLYQDVAFPGGPVSVSWDLAYHNTWGTFANDQRVRVVLRDVATDEIVETLFETKPGDPLVTGMTHYSADATIYGGRTMRLDLVLDVREHFLDVQLDGVKVEGLERHEGVHPLETPASDPTDPTDPTDPGTGPGTTDDPTITDSQVGGCSATGGQGGFAMIAVALVAMSRRRRR